MTLIDLNRTICKPELNYMTKGEMILFEKLRKSGRLTLFKCGNCRACGAEIIKEKLYCSQTCKEEKEKDDANVDMGH